MNIVLIMNQNSYVGREYLSCLRDNDIKIDVCSIGDFPEIDPIAQESCNNEWLPESQSSLESFHKFYDFESLKSIVFLNFLKKKQYKIGIQGGTGIINKYILNEFKLGILNFHPGLLPKYRGCSAPEWQLLEGNKIYSTCHFIDDGIDTGDIIKIKELQVNNQNYYKFRGSIYPITSLFMLEIIKEFIVYNGLKEKAIKQNEKHARYRKFIGKDKIKYIKDNWSNFEKVLNY